MNKFNILNSEIVKEVMDSMDSEWDRDCYKLIFSRGKSNSEIAEYSIAVEHLKSRNEDALERAKAYPLLNKQLRTWYI